MLFVSAVHYEILKRITQFLSTIVAINCGHLCSEVFSIVNNGHT